MFKNYLKISLRNILKQKGYSFINIAGLAMGIAVFILIALYVSAWTEISAVHSIVLACLIPLLVLLGHRTIGFVEADLGIRIDALTPGRGQTLDNMKSFFFTAPVVFHYIRYFLT